MSNGKTNIAAGLLLLAKEFVIARQQRLEFLFDCLLPKRRPAGPGNGLARQRLGLGANARRARALTRELWNREAAPQLT